MSKESTLKQICERYAVDIVYVFSSRVQVVWDWLHGEERNVWTAESCLRRELEAVVDTGRHILAKGFATCP